MKFNSAWRWAREKYPCIVISGLIFLILLANTNLSRAQSFPNNLRYPAEFEQQEAVWFGWGKNDTTLQNTAATVIRIIQGKVQVKMVVGSYELLENAIAFLSRKGVDVAQIEFFTTPGDRFWIRDNGPVFLVHNDSKLAVADFQWTSYGYYDWLMKDRPDLDHNNLINMKTMTMVGDESSLDQRIASLSGLELIKSNLVIEGGALETNGQGVLLQCKELTLQRNPGMSLKEIEQEFRQTLNIKKVIWLGRGTADDNIRFATNRKYLFEGTGGHLDEFVRFADTNTILLGWIEKEDIKSHPLNKITHKRMVKNLKILEKATDQDGQPFRIIKIPLPAIIELEPDNYPSAISSIEPGINKQKDPTIPMKKKVATVSYLNFLLTNGMLINASYINHGTPIEYEQRVQAIFREVFPDREQVWLDVVPLNSKGGGIHCITQTEPALELKTKTQVQ